MAELGQSTVPFVPGSTRNIVQLGSTAIEIFSCTNKGLVWDVKFCRARGNPRALRKVLRRKG